jgi:hypothetical protein
MVARRATLVSAEWQPSADVFSSYPFRLCPGQSRAGHLIKAPWVPTNTKDATIERIIYVFWYSDGCAICDERGCRRH